MAKFDIEVTVAPSDVSGRYVVQLDGVASGLLTRHGITWVYNHNEDKSLTKAPTPALAIARKLARDYLSQLPEGSGHK